MDSQPTRIRSRKLTRRGFLGAVGGAFGAALGVGALGHLRVDDDAETTEIVTVERAGRPLRTATVPAAWYDRERHARRVLGAVRARYADVAGVVDVSLGIDGEEVAGRPTSTIEVHVDPAEGVGTSLPDAFDGVASRFVEAVAPARLDRAARGSESGEPPARDSPPARRPVAVGGSATLHSSAGATASATCEVRWRGETFLMTCAHLFQDADGSCGNVLGQDVFADSGAKVGRIVGFDSAQDWVVVDNAATAVGFENTVAGVPGALCGRVTAAGLHHLKSEGVDVFKKGQATPEHRGPIRRVDVRHGGCHIGDAQVGSRYVDVDVPSQPGDSGGPVYHKFAYNGRRYLALVGAVSAEVAYTRASSAAGIHAKHGIAFASSVPGLD